MNYLTEPLNSSQKELADIRSVSIDPSLSKEERIAAYLSQIKDPYHFKCGQIEVHACYLSEGPSLSDCLKQLIE